MRKHLFGTILFSVIVGATVFVSEYFAALPTPSEVVEPPISCGFVDANNSNLPIETIVFYKQTQRFRADISADVSKLEGKVFLHFFRLSGNTTEFLTTQEFFPGSSSHRGSFSSVLVEIESLSKVKSFRNIYAIAEDIRDYKVDVIPIFNPEFAVPIIIEKHRKF